MMENQQMINQNSNKAKELPAKLPPQKALPPKPSVSSKTSVISSIRPPSWKTGDLAVTKRPTAATSPSLRPSSWKQTASPSVSSSQSILGTPTRANTLLGDPRQNVLPQPLQFDPSDLDTPQDEYRQQLVKFAAVSKPLDNGWTLFSHQKKAVLRSLARRRQILALDMGLGKTLIGCVWARSFVKTMKAKPIVICPVSLQQEWKRTLEEATGLEVQSGKDDEMENHSARIASWGKVPSVGREVSSPFVIIADEAHNMQSMTSARTQAVLKLTRHEQCKGVLLLTGTPMKNGKPSNLFPLLVAVRHPLGSHQISYEAHFCAGCRFQMGGRSVWKATGSTNLAQLHQLISSHLLHLTKAECLKDLPPQTREYSSVPVSSRQQIAHNEAMKELAKAYQYSSMGGSNDAVLGAVGRVRLVSSLAKIDATVAYARRILEEEPAVVIFTSFVQVAKSLHKKLTEAGFQGSILTGETPAQKRQGLVDDFQNGLTAFFVCTFGAGGVGLTLTAAHSIILLDRPWTPGDAHQAEDRVRRIGQTKPVKSIWMTAFDLDKQIDAMIQHKSAIAATVLANKGSDNPEASSEAAKLSIQQLVKSILPPAPQRQDGLNQTSILTFSQRKD